MQYLSSPKNIIVGLSGGVDSSVSAYLLQQAGHHVQAVFMNNWDLDATDTYCPAAQDLADAQAVCDTLNIELHVVSFADQYWQRVFLHFLTEYRQGRTPNPDILCNKEIKFQAFLEFAKQRGADFIATGHYVRSQQNSAQQQTLLLKGRDPQKDQSYFLYALTSTQLAQSIFPIGELHKNEVRAIAKKLHLKTHDKKDSTGICFIGERKFKNFLNEYLPARTGMIETIEGDVIGTHDGVMFYTIGQRQGLQIGGLKGKPEQPWYVAAKDIARNALIVVQHLAHPALFKTSLIATDLHWINQPAPILPCNVAAKIRYRQADQACDIKQINDAHFRVTFSEPQRAVTPGQSIVFYQGDICLGGGIIVG